MKNALVTIMKTAPAVVEEVGEEEEEEDVEEDEVDKRILVLKLTKKTKKPLVRFMSATFLSKLTNQTLKESSDNMELLKKSTSPPSTRQENQKVLRLCALQILLPETKRWKT